MFYYCPHCGHICKGKKNIACAACGHAMLPVPEDYLSPNGSFFASPEMRETFIHTVIETGEAYDSSLANQRDQLLQTKKAAHAESVAQKVEDYKATRIQLKCPVCGSTNLSDISTLGKVVKISLIGVWGAGDLGKKRRCETCGHKF